MIFKNKSLWLIFSLILLILIIIKTNCILNWYSLASDAMRPKYRINNTIFVTNIGEISRGDILTYNHTDPNNIEFPFISRLVGKPGDTILIENNITYVNGENFDKNIDLSYQYKVSFYIYNQIKNSPEFITTPIYGKIFPSDTLRVFMEEKFAKKRNLNSKKIKLPKEKIDEFIKEQYGEKWNSHFFGPIIIPPDKYFVLGDNRDNAMDSRYIGLIDKKDILGRAIFSLNF